MFYIYLIGRELFSNEILLNWILQCKCCYVYDKLRDNDQNS